MWLPEPAVAARALPGKSNTMAEWLCALRADSFEVDDRGIAFPVNGLALIVGISALKMNGQVANYASNISAVHDGRPFQNPTIRNLIVILETNSCKSLITLGAIPYVAGPP